MIVAQVYRAGYCYQLHADGTLERRELGGTWEVVDGLMSDWPEVGR